MNDRVARLRGDDGRVRRMADSPLDQRLDKVVAATRGEGRRGRLTEVEVRPDVRCIGVRLGVGTDRRIAVLDRKLCDRNLVR